MQKIKYISNRELLAEIQRSKMTYCHFTSPNYAAYDVIIESIDDLTPEVIVAALQIKLLKLAKLQAELTGISADDLVFRVMSDLHLPPEEDEKRRKKSRSGQWVAKTNFPPFRHVIVRDGVPIEVGRSHWHGDLENGGFSLKHGNITDRLASMFMLMVERYARGGSWRGYCVDEATEALTQRGWLTMDEITTDDIILSYHEGKLKWSKIKSIFRDDFDGKMFKLTVTGMNALVTPHHKFVTDSGLKEVELLMETDRLILTGEAVAGGNGNYSDEFVELVGWFVTEGNIYFEDCRTYGRVTIYQNEGEHADRIRACVAKLNAKFGEGSRPPNESGNINLAFHLTKETCQKLLEVASDRVLTMPFILALSQSQRELLINTMIDGDGWRTKGWKDKAYRRYCQKNKEHVDAFLVLCTMAGYRVSYKQREIVSYGKETTIYTMNMFSRQDCTRVENIDFHGGKNSGRRSGVVGKGKVAHPNTPTIDYQGKVWCPETEYGSFMCRRNGYVYLTGNTYNDEMRSHALVQLSQVGLQFDESRSENPFAFYTQIIKNSFRRILNLERRNQDIRDDLLIMSGAQPSYTRQIDNEFDQRDDWQKASEPVAAHADRKEQKEAPKRRGRKPKVPIE